MFKKTIRFSILTVVAILLTQVAPVPSQTELQAAIRGECTIEMGSRRGWLTGRCKGSTDEYCRSEGDCEEELKLILEN